MKYRLQTATVDHDDAWTLVRDAGFRNLREARDFFDTDCGTPSGSLDWRVGFFARMRDGKYFRLVDQAGRQVGIRR